MHLITFSLDAGPHDRYVRLPFLVEGKPWTVRSNGRALSGALSLRSAGDMRFAAGAPNPCRDRFFSALRLDGKRVAARVQTHSRDVLALEGGWAADAPLPPGDGLAANDPGTTLAVTVADCLPVFLADTESGAVALVHSGWKGTGIALRALSLMRERWGTDPRSVSAVLGPCIRGCCYEVDAERAALFEEEFGPACAGKPSGPAVRRERGRNCIDLQAANAALLQDAGVENLAVCVDCTFTDDRLGSFRREGPDRFTRMAALLGWLPEETLP